MASLRLSGHGVSKRPLTSPPEDSEEDEEEDLDEEEEDEEEEESIKSSGQDQVQEVAQPAESKKASTDTEPRKKRKYEPRRKKQSLALNRRRNFDHFDIKTIAPTSADTPAMATIDYSFSSEPSAETPKVVEEHKVSFSMHTVGSCWVLSIESVDKDAPLNEALTPSPNFGTHGVDPSTMWMLRLPISVVKPDAAKTFVETHFEQCQTKDAMRTRAPRTTKKKHEGKSSWACAASHPSGAIWRTPEVNFSDVYSTVMTLPSSTSPNKLLVKTIGPFLHATMDGASIADINKSKNEISRMLLHWNIELVRVDYRPDLIVDGSHKQKRVSYAMRLPIVLDTSFSNAPPRVLSPPNGIFDTDQLHMRITFERQTSSFDTLVLRDFSWKVFDRFALKASPPVDLAGPLNFVSSIPERFYAPRRIPFDMTPMLLSNTTSSEEKEGGASKKVAGEIGIRARHYIVVLPGTIKPSDSIGKPTSLGELDAYEIEFEGEGGVSFDASPHSSKSKVLTKDLLPNGHGSMLIRCCSATSNPVPLFRHGIPFDSVVAVLTTFVYGNGLQSSSPFFWRCFTNLSGILHKTDPELSSMRSINNVLEILNKEATSRATKNDNHRAHYHFDVDASTMFASSCNLALRPLPNTGHMILNKDSTRDFHVPSPLFMRIQNVGAAQEKEPRKVLTGALYMNVPDFILPKDKAYATAYADDEEDEDEEEVPAAEPTKIKYQHVFVAERLIWALKFSAVSRAAPLGQPAPPDVGKPLLTIEGEEFYADKNRWEKGLTKAQLVQRIISDTRTTEFSRLLWSTTTIKSGGAKKFKDAVKAFQTLQAQNPEDYTPDPTEKTLTKVLDELPDMHSTILLVSAFESPGSKATERNYKLSPASLAQYADMGLYHGQNAPSMGRDSNKIRLPAEIEFYEPAVRYVQAIIHADHVQRQTIWEQVMMEDVKRTGELIPDYGKKRFNSNMRWLGELTSLMLFDCMRIADFLFSNKICNIILGQMITETELYAGNLDKSSLFEADAEVSALVQNMPCQEYYTIKILTKDVVATSKCVVSSFAVFLAIRCICEDFVYDEAKDAYEGLCIRRGMDFVFAGLAALLGPSPNFSQWVLGDQFKHCRDHFEGFSQDTHNLLVKVISKYHGESSMAVEVALKDQPAHEPRKCNTCKHKSKDTGELKVKKVAKRPRQANPNPAPVQVPPPPPPPVPAAAAAVAVNFLAAPVPLMDLGWNDGDNV